MAVECPQVSKAVAYFCKSVPFVVVVTVWIMDIVGLQKELAVFSVGPV